MECIWCVFVFLNANFRFFNGKRYPSIWLCIYVVNVEKSSWDFITKTVSGWLSWAWFGLAWLRCKFYVSIKCTWNSCPSKWYGLVPQPNKAITTQCRFYEHHRQRAIELMKYKLYFGVSLVTITNDILVEIAELNKAFGYSPNTCMENNHRSRNVQFVYTQYHTVCVYVWDAIYCAHWWMMTHGFYFGA